MELACISDWLKTNKLSLSIEKSKYMIFHTTQKKVALLQLKIDHAPIDRVYEFNFLSLTINENLNWKSCISKIADKISKSMGILNKLKHFLPFILIAYMVLWIYQIEDLRVIPGKLQK